MTRAHAHLGRPPRRRRTLAKRRPAETGTLVAGAVALVAGRVFGWDAEVAGAVTVIVAAVPAGITAAVARWRRG